MPCWPSAPPRFCRFAFIGAFGAADAMYAPVVARLHNFGLPVGKPARAYMAAVMGLTIEPEWRQSVIDNMAATAAVAELLLAFPLDDHIEPAPVFEA